jgi:hypothetical protein
MKHGLTLVELAEKVQAQSDDRADYIASTNAIHVTADTMVLNPNDREAVAFNLNNHTHGQISAYTGIPKRYYDRMKVEAPELLSANIENWFDANPKKRMVRTIGDSARAFLSDRYRTLDHVDLMEAVLPILVEKDVQVVSAEVTETKFYLKVIDPKLKGKVDWGSGGHNIGRAKDDEIIWGATISNSEVGSGSLAVSTMTLSAWCDNLMIIGKEFNKYHVGRSIGDTGEFYKDETRQADDKATFLKLRDTVDHALTEVSMQETLDKYSLAAQNPIKGDPVKVVEKLATKLRSSDEEKGSILRHLIEAGGLNQWALANAVTRTAEDATSYDRATELESAGMAVIELSPTAWREIGAA